MAMSVNCPAGGRHEIIEVLVSVASTREKIGGTIPGRICRKCWLRDTYIEEGE